MRIGRTAIVSDGNLTSNVQEAVPAAYNGATNYGLAAIVGVTTGTTTEVYESLQAANTGHTPSSSPLWWKWIGTVYAAYNAGTSYAADAWVTKNHRLFRSLIGSNLGNDPETSPAKWQDRGPSNRMAMFDLTTSQGTVRPDEISWSIDVAGRIDAVGLGGLSASSLNIVIEVDGDEIYNEDHSLVSDAGIGSWLEWLYEPIVRKRSLFVTGLPTEADPTVSFSLTGPGTVEIDHFALSYLRRVGFTQKGGESGITRYSSIETNQFAERTYIKRGYTKRAQITAEFQTEDYDNVTEFLAELDGEPLLILGSDLHRSMNVFGSVSDFRTRVGQGAISTVTATLEGY